MALLTLRHVTMTYENAVAAEDISFSVEQGDYLLIVGENGSGKSTLVKGMLGLKRPHSGEVLTGDGLKRHEIGYLPQQTQAQRDFPASVMEVVLSGCLNRRGLRPFYSAAEKRIALHSMEQLGVLALSKRSYRELSGGQQQRVLLARALCQAEKMILLDEPVAGLDPMAAQEMYDVIRHLNREKGVAVIMVSHDVGTALKDAGKVVCMHKTLAFYGTTEEYMKSDCGRYYINSGLFGRGGCAHD